MSLPESSWIDSSGDFDSTRPSLSVSIGFRSSAILSFRLGPTCLSSGSASGSVSSSFSTTISIGSSSESFFSTSTCTNTRLILSSSSVHSYVEQQQSNSPPLPLEVVLWSDVEVDPSKGGALQLTLWAVGKQSWLMWMSKEPEPSRMLHRWLCFWHHSEAPVDLKA